MITLRYDLITAFNQGVLQHPQLQMKDLGYEVLSFEGVPIGDCAIMEVKELIEPLEKYLTEIKEK